MCRLPGYELFPRLKPIHSQKLYLPDSADAARYEGLAPLIYQHVNPYGTFALDMTTRIPISDAEAA